MVRLDKFIIEGGKKLKGTVEISGSKNAVLPIMTATLMASGKSVLKSVPSLRDVQTMKHLLESLGAKVEFGDHEMILDTSSIVSQEAPYDFVKTMRASIYVLGPLVSRFGMAKVSLPGGCAWGPRPVNLHIEGLKKLGAKIELERGYIVARARKLRGAAIVFDIPSVGATGNCLMAAVLAKGRTVIKNAAREPEITSLANYLNRMGANITGAGTDHLEIEGVERLKPAECTIIPDRIETGTFLVAAAIAGGNVLLKNTFSPHVAAVIEKLRDCGTQIETGEDWIRIRTDGKVQSVDVTTAVFPGFPTDMQAQWMALMSIGKGSSVITDTIYHDRFTHVAELRRLGANITLDHNVAVVKGVHHLSGAPVMSTDLRASASLILAGLVAKGRTDLSRIYHIDRGYESIEKKLQLLGASIRRDLENLVT